MLTKRVLLMYIGFNSGHHQAARAIEKALYSLDPHLATSSINSVNYTNPVLEKIINRTYLGIIKRKPEVWEYLYDNRRIAEKTRRLRALIRRYNSSRLKALLDDFQPDTVICTQAFPCGMVADYKVTFNSTIPLVGILTDFYPHSYWIYDAVNRYVVASEEARARLIENGVAADRISILGIPIDISFNAPLNRQQVIKRLGLEESAKTILVMGGSGGLGPIKGIVKVLDKVNSKIQIIVVTGNNTRLQSYLQARIKKFNKRVRLVGYADNMNELMGVSDILITKPGGLTVSEALAKALPIIIVNPIPGQEAKNTQFLLQKKAALKVDHINEMAHLVESICNAPSRLKALKEAAAALGRPESTLDIARMILEL